MLPSLQTLRDLFRMDVEVNGGSFGLGYVLVNLTAHLRIGMVKKDDFMDVHFKRAELSLR